jgi:acetyltransferase-like isoleucine patch superfamily enzyme
MYSKFSSLRKRFLNWLVAADPDFKRPTMVKGYRCPQNGFQPRTRISDTAFFYHRDRIRVADNVFVWHYTILDGTGTLTIQEGAQIGAWVGIFTHSSHIAIRLYGNHYQDVPEQDKVGYPVEPVTIGRYAFIGAGAKILPGVTIGDGAIVSAGAVVTKPVQALGIVAGNPARTIGTTEKLDEPFLTDPAIAKWYREWR